jgi:hypothetical protein
MYRENPEEADDRQYYDYHLDRNGSLLEAENQALSQPTVIGSVCDGCGSKFDAMDIKVGVCYCCKKEIKQTDL